MKRNSNKPIRLDLLIFDMDGVLVDVSGSYRRAILQTARIYLRECLGPIHPLQHLLKPHAVSHIKEIGGFNNDWDVTSGLLGYLFSLLDEREIEAPTYPDSLEEAVGILRECGNRLRESFGRFSPKVSPEELKEQVKAAGGGLEGMIKVVGERSFRLVFNHGDLKTTNLVKRIFQEIYLGSRFEKLHGCSPIFYHGEGLYMRERLLVRPSSLERLAQMVPLAIATGRPSAEALLSLEHLGIGRYFSVLVALEDCEAEEERILKKEGLRPSLGKPDPFSILKAAKSIKERPAGCAYIGDIVDDIRAALNAKSELEIIPIGCLAAYAEKEKGREQFLKEGAELVIDRVDQMLELLEAGRIYFPLGRGGSAA